MWKVIETCDKNLKSYEVFPRMLSDKNAEKADFKSHNNPIMFQQLL